MKQEIIILGAKKYSMTDEDSGEVLKGTNLYYMEGFDFSFDEPSMKGVFALKVGAPYELFEKLGNLPAVYNADFRKKPDSKGKAVDVLVSVEYVRDVIVG